MFADFNFNTSQIIYFTHKFISLWTYLSFANFDLKKVIILRINLLKWILNHKIAQIAVATHEKLEQISNEFKDLPLEAKPKRGRRKI